MFLNTIQPPTPFWSLFIKKSDPPGFWPKLGYFAFSLASSVLTGFELGSWDSCIKKQNVWQDFNNNKKRTYVLYVQITPMVEMYFLLMMQLFGLIITRPWWLLFMSICSNLILYINSSDYFTRSFLLPVTGLNSTWTPTYHERLDFNSFRVMECK